jgi:molybdopterin molybdotransferase
MNADLLSVDEAYGAVSARCVPLAPCSLPLAMARGAVLREEVTTDSDSPPFDKSVVDGYAIRAGDLPGGVGTLQLGEELYAGAAPTRPLLSGEAALIMTGAPVPEGADAIVMIERTRREGSVVFIDDPGIVPGRSILRRGAEFTRGTTVMHPGERLSAARLGVLASVGRSSVRVVPAPQVAIVPTGDELVEPDQVPGLGQIRNSNAVMLEALVADAGAIPLLSPIAPDEPQTLSALLEEGLESDVLLVTGGVSAGFRDLVPECLTRLGVERVFHKVRLKPGKPLWFGIGPGRGKKPGALVFGLPGNPVSTIVGFLLFVKPALDVLGGRPARPLVLPSYPLAAPFVHAGDRPTFHPARLHNERLEPLAWAGSADLRTVAGAHGFAHFPAGDRSYAAGDVVAFLRLG